METRTYTYWKSYVWPFDKLRDLRMGQSFVNHFGFRNESELFFEANERKANKLILGVVDRYNL